jgi:DNA-binding LacI/PurR family transcriptional regulator
MVWTLTMPAATGHAVQNGYNRAPRAMINHPRNRSSPSPAPERVKTMADLARLAGVSKITISRAFSGKGHVNESTRSKILRLAEKHRYKLNASAQSLRLRRSHTVAVVVEMVPSAERPMSGAYPLELLGGIMQELSGSNFSALLTTRQGATLPAIQSADALILLGQGPHLDAVRVFDQFRLPMVVWGASPANDNHIVVGSDNRQGGALAAARIVAIGRRHPVFIGDTDHPEFQERYSGFATTLAAHGIKASVHRSRGLNELGLRVPDDVSVVGYDDTLVGATFIPPLTTIHQNWTEGGRLLARKALALINGDAPTSETLPTFLVARGT